MEKTDLAPARLHMVQAIEQGMSWDEAAKCAGLRLTAVYRKIEPISYAFLSWEGK